MVKAAVTVTAVIISVFTALLVFITEKQQDEDKTVKVTADTDKSEHYTKVRTFLSQSGADYMLKTQINPVYYDLFKTAIGAAGAVVGFMINPLAAILLFFAGFKLPDLTLKASNKADNKAIMGDIKAVYDTLNIKSQAGVFFSTSLPECYKSVENGRLKAALYKLNTDIKLKGDIVAAINDFQQKFKSDYIDMFCVIILQALESGQTVQIMNDMSKQLVNIRKAVEEEKKSKLERDVITVQLLIYIAMIGVILFYLTSIIGGLSSIV